MYVADHPEAVPAVTAARSSPSTPPTPTRASWSRRLEELLGATVTHCIVQRARPGARPDRGRRALPARSPKPPPSRLQARQLASRISVSGASPSTPLVPLSLDDVLATADLQTRTDRKYIADPARLRSTARRARRRHGRARDRPASRPFRYESVYFDTPALDSYLGAAHGAGAGFKVRTRTYVDAGDCMLEVKVRSGRGETLKHRCPYDTSRRSALDDAALDFVRRHAALAAAGTLDAGPHHDLLPQHVRRARHQCPAHRRRRPRVLRRRPAPRCP